LAAGGEKTLEELRTAVAKQPASAHVRLSLGAACEKAGAKEEAQRAYWAAYLLAGEGDAARSRAREALLRLDRRWKEALDLEKDVEAQWKKAARKLKAKDAPALRDLGALWSRLPLVVEEPWRSTRDPLADFTRQVFAWKVKTVLGKDGAPVLELPAKERKDFPGRTAVVEALEVTIEGTTYSDEPELEVRAQVTAGKAAWWKPGEKVKAPVWVRARRVGSTNEAREPIKLWLRYYPPKGIGVALPLGDPRMRGASEPIKLGEPLTASVRLESLLPRNKIEVTNVTLTLYLRLK